MKRTFDGRKMSAILVAGFAVVISVNLFAAVVAKRTFGGIVVENSYAASQDYNRWLAEAERERALGWTVEPIRQPDGRIALVTKGVPASAQVQGEARHPLGRMPDMALHFGDDLISSEILPEGRWTVRLTVRANGHLFRAESQIR